MMEEFYRNLYDFGLYVAKENTIDADCIEIVEDMRKSVMNGGADITIYIETMISIAKSALGVFATYLDIVIPECNACERIGNFNDLMELFNDLGILPTNSDEKELKEPPINEFGVPIYNCCQSIDSDLYRACSSILHKLTNLTPCSKDFRRGIYALVMILSENELYKYYYDSN